MATGPKSRILVSLAPGSKVSLKSLARARKEPLATVASRMIDIGLELEEDIVFAQKAHTRATRKGVKYISHADAWATLLK